MVAVVVLSCHDSRGWDTLLGIFCSWNSLWKTSILAYSTKH